MTVSALVATLNKEALGSALSKSESLQKPQVEGSKFKEMLNHADSSMEFANAVGLIDQTTGAPTVQMQSIEGSGVQFGIGDQIELNPGSNGADTVLNMLGEVNKGHMQMDSIMNQILYSGKKFSNQEMLVIQAHVYQAAQMTELTVKVAEHGITSVKSVLNTQVQ